MQADVCMHEWMQVKIEKRQREANKATERETEVDKEREINEAPE